MSGFVFLKECRGAYCLLLKMFHGAMIQFLIISFIIPASSMAQIVPSGTLPPMVLNTSVVMNPPVLRGLMLDPQNAFNFQFILQQGDDVLYDQELETESQRLIKYFLTSLTLPEDEMWVNLSPYEKDRIIPDDFAQTEMGQGFLLQDYLLKKLSASLIYPEHEFGEKFWERLYAKMHERFQSVQMPNNILHKIWIVPDTAHIYRQENKVFILETKLKVMVEEDYLAKQQYKSGSGLVARDSSDSRGSGDLDMIVTTGSMRATSHESQVTEPSELSTQIIRDILVPEIEREVNEGEHFAQLRQIYHSFLLASWYKKNLQKSILAQHYVDQHKVAGLESEGQDGTQAIYQQYLKMFQEGVYDYIREDYDPAQGELIPRRYFAGGMQLQATFQESEDASLFQKTVKEIKAPLELVDGFFHSDQRQQALDNFMSAEAMSVSEESQKGYIGEISIGLRELDRNINVESMSLYDIRRLDYSHIPPEQWQRGDVVLIIDENREAIIYNIVNDGYFLRDSNGKEKIKRGFNELILLRPKELNSKDARHIILRKIYDHLNITKKPNLTEVFLLFKNLFLYRFVTITIVYNLMSESKLKGSFNDNARSPLQLEIQKIVRGIFNAQWIFNAEKNYVWSLDHPYRNASLPKDFDLEKEVFDVSHFISSLFALQQKISFEYDISINRIYGHKPMLEKAFLSIAAVVNKLLDENLSSRARLKFYEISPESGAVLSIRVDEASFNPTQFPYLLDQDLKEAVEILQHHGMEIFINNYNQRCNLMIYFPVTMTMTYQRLQGLDYSSYSLDHWKKGDRLLILENEKNVFIDKIIRSGDGRIFFEVSRDPNVKVNTVYSLKQIQYVSPSIFYNREFKSGIIVQIFKSLMSQFTASQKISVNDINNVWRKIAVYNTKILETNDLDKINLREHSRYARLNQAIVGYRKKRVKGILDTTKGYPHGMLREDVFIHYQDQFGSQDPNVTKDELNYIIRRYFQNHDNYSYKEINTVVSERRQLEALNILDRQFLLPEPTIFTREELLHASPDLTGYDLKYPHFLRTHDALFLEVRSKDVESRLIPISMFGLQKLLDISSFDWQEVLDRILDEYGILNPESIKKRDYNFSFDIRADKRRFMLVLMNICQHIKDNKHLEDVFIQTKVQDENLTIMIVAKRKHFGAGKPLGITNTLEMSLCNLILESHGGSLDIVNISNQAIRFDIKIPFGKKFEPVEAKVNASGEKASQKREEIEKNLHAVVLSFQENAYSSLTLEDVAKVYFRRFGESLPLRVLRSYLRVKDRKELNSLGVIFFSLRSQHYWSISQGDNELDFSAANINEGSRVVAEKVRLHLLQLLDNQFLEEDATPLRSHDIFSSFKSRSYLGGKEGQIKTFLNRKPRLMVHPGIFINSSNRPLVPLKSIKLQALLDIESFYCKYFFDRLLDQYNFIGNKVKTIKKYHYEHMLEADRDRFVVVVSNLLQYIGERMSRGTLEVSSEVDKDKTIKIVLNAKSSFIDNGDLDQAMVGFVVGRVGNGLAVSKEIIKAHGGSLVVDKVVGKQVRFTITLPVGKSFESIKEDVEEQKIKLELEKEKIAANLRLILLDYQKEDNGHKLILADLVSLYQKRFLKTLNERIIQSYLIVENSKNNDELGNIYNAINEAATKPSLTTLASREIGDPFDLAGKTLAQLQSFDLSSTPISEWKKGDVVWVDEVGLEGVIGRVFSGNQFMIYFNKKNKKLYEANVLRFVRPKELNQRSMRLIVYKKIHSSITEKLGAVEWQDIILAIQKIPIYKGLVSYIMQNDFQRSKDDLPLKRSSAGRPKKVVDAFNLAEKSLAELQSFDLSRTPVSKWKRGDVVLVDGISKEWMIEEVISSSKFKVRFSAANKRVVSADELKFVRPRELSRLPIKLIVYRKIYESLRQNQEIITRDEVVSVIRTIPIYASLLRRGMADNFRELQAELPLKVHKSEGLSEADQFMNQSPDALESLSENFDAATKGGIDFHPQYVDFKETVEGEFSFDAPSVDNFQSVQIPWLVPRILQIQRISSLPLLFGLR